MRKKKKDLHKNSSSKKAAEKWNFYKFLEKAKNP
jgi:hypothetical protein